MKAPERLDLPITVATPDGEEHEVARLVYVLERTCKPETVSISYCEDAIICSACKTVCDDLESFYYCPNCGAKVVAKEGE